MTTKEKFKPVAQLIRKQLQLCLLRERPVEASRDIARLANDLAILIVDAYPRFDRDEFLGQCGIDDAMLKECGLPTLRDK